MRREDPLPPVGGDVVGAARRWGYHIPSCMSNSRPWSARPFSYQDMSGAVGAFFDEHTGNSFLGRSAAVSRSPSGSGSPKVSAFAGVGNLKECLMGG